MSILLFIIFTILLLIIGFGFSGWNLVFITIILTMGLGIFMSSIDIQNIIDNWSERRCDVDILFTSGLYKNTTDKRTTTEFTQDNFTFCIKNIWNEVLQIALSPILLILGKQIDSVNVLNDVFLQLRNLKSNMMKSFEAILEPFWTRFYNTGLQFSQVYQRMMSAMKRVGGIAVATLYMGIGIQKSIENLIEFIVKIVGIILVILISLFIVFFFGLLPVLPLILTTIIFLQQSGYGSMVGGMADSFCFDPSTNIQLKDGSNKRIDKIIIGDILVDGGIVEGILIAELKKPYIMYSINNIIVSGTHLIYYNNEWISVSEHPNAIQCISKCKEVICLRTTTKNIIIDDLKFRDWEELPNDTDKLWNDIVSLILNNKIINEIPKDYPIFGKNCFVSMNSKLIEISKIKMGDYIDDGNNKTRVTGIYNGINDNGFEAENDASDGVWILKDNLWKHNTFKKTKTKTTTKTKGIHLTTESGTFWIKTNSFSGQVRDFTELGDKINMTYNLVKSILKKYPLKEEDETRILNNRTCYPISC